MSWVLSSENRVIIMRGLPGSGKTTKAQSYHGTIVSADEFFMHGGRYEFDRSKLANAHGACRRAFRAAIERGDPVIVVDNTNIRHEEYAEYVKIAKEAGYDVIIDVVETDLSSEELAKRDVHAVPVEVIEHMRQRWQP